MYKTVASYLDPLEAHIVCGRLQAEGFDAHVADDHTNLANWEWRTAIGGTRVRVHEDDHAAARALIAELDGGAFALVDEHGHAPADGTPLHPDRETWSSRLALVFGLGFGIPLPWRRRQDVRGRDLQGDDARVDRRDDQNGEGRNDHDTLEA